MVGIEGVSDNVRGGRRGEWVVGWLGKITRGENRKNKTE